MKTDEKEFEEMSAGEGMFLPIPKTWGKKALVAFTNGVEGEEGASVVVRVESIDARTKLTRFVDGLMIELARTLPGFSLIERRDSKLGGQPALEIEFTWTAQGTVYRQTHTSVMYSPGQVACVITSASQRHLPEFKETFEAVLRGARFTPAGK
ncbi:DcrB-related protein [Nannocystis bainbridge]|uniref:DcrB-related protein n=1 Tax=Nannocystis bainbridge TaxID=2995303 RepID=A0ABT5DT25_9BACT|nr:DcrB-related protein [Nannocystis bainbridge]MDC0716775.1 DcrB-related protein [Nannocystis bainbridge]